MEPLASFARRSRGPAGGSASRAQGGVLLSRSNNNNNNSCDLEGNRAGLGCLEHLRNALSFAVVTEWPVGVYPRRRRWSPPHACLVRAVGRSSPCECMSGQNKDLICCLLLFSLQAKTVAGMWDTPFLLPERLFIRRFGPREPVRTVSANPGRDAENPWTDDQR